MERTSFFVSGETSSLPLIIALPGIVTKNEPTRIDSILTTLSTERKIIGIKMNYVEKKSRKDDDIYTFDMQQTERDLEEVINMALAELKIDSRRIGLISNSISAFPATQYLIKHQNGSAKIRCYASISPLLGWNYFANKEIREHMEREKMDLAMNGHGAGERRSVIPKEMIPEMMKMDALADLEGYTQNGMAVMTILGTKDRKASPESIRRYHFALGGKEEDLVCLDADHDVPNSNHYVIEFMVKHLAKTNLAL